ncbi:hypothetical protein [Lentiprolixibacter aurantiacus]|uniref:Uncharacterized protein n=1 Tax=Lentiprolixibacter aurantiacus TaxID=2993939 RepID=A0AAE3MIM4_9FLAO|nr:hypothetical protein [Lentiprolixibacter aurantiacus]MCX2718241.1 hypothetical protein [Lentiprolixibacter aurantiacus]
MKAILLSIVLMGWFNFMQPDPGMQEIQVNDVLVIQQPSGPDFKHIHFPKKNFIIKRGGIANMKQLAGKKVIVEAISYDKDGSTLITLSRQDGMKFFRAFPTVKASLEDALDSGELRK